jgi:hypothetical protein
MLAYAPAAAAKVGLWCASEDENMWHGAQFYSYLVAAYILQCKTVMVNALHDALHNEWLPCPEFGTNAGCVSCAKAAQDSVQLVNCHAMTGPKCKKWL